MKRVFWIIPVVCGVLGLLTPDLGERFGLAFLALMCGCLLFIPEDDDAK